MKVRAGVGLSSADDSETAGREAGSIALAGLDNVAPALVIVYAALRYDARALLRGIRAGRVYEANLGMLVIAILAIARFFDSDLEFVVRGVAFIAIGLGFLVTNLVVFKRRART